MCFSTAFTVDGPLWLPAGGTGWLLAAGVAVQRDLGLGLLLCWTPVVPHPLVLTCSCLVLCLYTSL
jgi:hypothetical protein